MLPTSSGMFCAVHVSVPMALPTTPVELDQATDVTPTLSDARPWNVMLPAVVEIMVEAGLVMRSDGGVLSPDEPGAGGVGGFGVGGFGVGGAGVCCD